MSVNATTSVTSFMAQYVESQGRTSATLTSAETAALQLALTQFELNSTQLEEVNKLLDALQVMRGMMVDGSLSYTALDSIEMSIQTLIQTAMAAPATQAVAAGPSQPLPANVQAFSDEYLTSSYLQAATVWPGADTQLQADLATFALAPREVSVATQYMYDIADQRRYLAAIDAALQAPDGFLYATATDADYPAYLNYVQARADTAARIDADVATVQGILNGMVNVWESSFDPIPWSLQLTDPQQAVPPANPTAQAQFEIVEDKFVLGQLGTQARSIETQMTQLTALLSAKTVPPMPLEQVHVYTTQLSDLKRQFKLISADRQALQARVTQNTALASGASLSADSSLKIDLDVNVAQSKLAAFAPTPVNTGPSDPAPTSTLQSQLSADKAAYSALVSAPPPSPPPPGQPPAPPEPTLQLIDSYMGQLAYQLEVPVGIQLTDQQTDEIKLLWAHRTALSTQYQAVKAEMAALKARIDYAQGVLDGWKPYQTSEWNQLSAAVALARQRREAGEQLPPTAGALATPPADTVAWKLSGTNPAHMLFTRIDNFLLEPADNDLVYQRLSEFAAYIGLINTDSREAELASTTLQTTISKINTSTSAGQTQKANAQTQLSKLNSVIAWLDSFAPDAATAYDNAEAARTVTAYAEVSAKLASVASSENEVLYDDQVLAALKRDLAQSTSNYYATTTDAASNTARIQYTAALYQLALNVYNQKLYTFQVATALDANSQQGAQDSLDAAEAAYDPLLETALARYFDYAYAKATSSSAWPRTVTGATTDAQKAAEVMSHFGGDVYAIIDPIPTTNLL